jgi:hypothetical protein
MVVPVASANSFFLKCLQCSSAADAFSSFFYPEDALYELELEKARLEVERQRKAIALEDLYRQKLAQLANH